MEAKLMFLFIGMIFVAGCASQVIEPTTSTSTTTTVSSTVTTTSTTPTGTTTTRVGVGTISPDNLVAGCPDQFRRKIIDADGNIKYYCPDVSVFGCSGLSYEECLEQELDDF
ncbi:hypothetical protein LCGC14_0534740 [marine sediment metagenome]|uniref:Uncharacterized protein n=1 Tax=marine sediment metagenome TaxID=412755 RepID=A0A0F9V2Q9_9ZZZZ